MPLNWKIDECAVYFDRLRLRARHAGKIAELDEAVADSLRRACEASRALADVRAVDLADLVTAEHGALVRAIAEQVPAHLRLASGRELAINYPHGAPPFIESYLQDFFGMAESPRLAGQPLVVHLWAPNRRALQVTSDLASFWRQHYPDLRRQLMRRYPKHHWPENPQGAKSVRFVRDA